jgi:lipid A ethanolaminephosphotransferase
MTLTRLCILLSLWIAATANHSFWALVFSVNGAGPHLWLFAASLGVALIALNTLVLRLLSPGRAARPMLSILLLLAAITSWFMDTYGVSIDTEMMRNLVQTNVTEAWDFIGWSLAWRVLWQAGLPIFLVWKVSLTKATWTQSLLQYAICIVLSLIVFFSVSLPMYASYASFFRNQRSAEELLAPGNVIRAGVKLVMKNQKARMPFVMVGSDAHRQTVAHTRPMLTLLPVPRKLFWLMEPPRIRPALCAKPTLAVIEPDACSSTA